MPALSDIPIRLSIEEISNSWSSRRGRQLSPAMLKSLEGILAEIETNYRLDTAINYRILPVTGRGPGWLALEDVKLDSAVLDRYLHQARYLAFGACTLGQRLVHQVREWFAAKQKLQAVLLDEIGTLLLYRVSDYFESMVGEQARSMGMQASSALNPGDDGFDISLQGMVLELAGGGDIGVSLQGSGTLVPHKSLTAVMGLGPDMPTWTRGDHCSRCRSRKYCPHRREANSCVPA